MSEVNVNDRYEDPRLIEDLFEKEIASAAQRKKFSKNQLAILIIISAVSITLIASGSYFLSRDFSEIKVLTKEVIGGFTVALGGILTGSALIYLAVVRRRHRQASSEHMGLTEMYIHDPKVADKLESILGQGFVELPRERQLINRVRNVFSRYNRLNSTMEESWKPALRIISRMNEFQVGKHLGYVQDKIVTGNHGYWKSLRKLLLSQASMQEVSMHLKDSTIPTEDRLFIYEKQLEKEKREEKDWVLLLKRMEDDVVEMKFGLLNYQADYQSHCLACVEKLSSEDAVEHYASKAAVLLYSPLLALPKLRKLIEQPEVRKNKYLMEKLALAANAFRSNAHQDEPFLVSQYSQLLIEMLPFVPPCFVPQQQWTEGGCYYGMYHHLLSAEAQYNQLVSLTEEERIEFFNSSSVERQQEWIRNHFLGNLPQFLKMGEKFRNEVYKVMRPAEMFAMVDQLDPQKQQSEIERIAYYQGALSSSDESVVLSLTSEAPLSPGRAMFAGLLANPRFTEGEKWTLSRLAGFCSRISLDTNRDLFLQGLRKNHHLLARLNRETKSKPMKVARRVGRRVEEALRRRKEKPALELRLIDNSCLKDEEAIKNYFKIKLGIAV
jgi:hypothetical protein